MSNVTKLINLTKTAYEEFPTRAHIQLVGADKVEFKMGPVWLHDINLDVRPPYPAPWAETIKYVIRAIEGIEPVPYENRAECEQYIDDVKDMMNELIQRLKDIAKKDKIGLLSETVIDPKSGSLVRVEISSLAN